MPTHKWKYSRTNATPLQTYNSDLVGEKRCLFKLLMEPEGAEKGADVGGQAGAKFVDVRGRQ